MLGEGSSWENIGLSCNNSDAWLRGGSFTGRGGQTASGIENYNATVHAEGVSARGAGASNENYGVDNPYSSMTTVTQSVLEGATNSVSRSGGTVTVSNSRLVGGPVVGDVTCVLVTRDGTVSTDGSTCP